MPAEYCLQQRGIEAQSEHRAYRYGPTGRAYDPAIPLIGALPSRLPSGLLSQNPIAIESRLFGIGANNLVYPQQSINPKLLNLPIKSFFKQPARIEEKPCIDYGHQRPFPLPY